MEISTSTMMVGMFLSRGAGKPILSLLAQAKKNRKKYLFICFLCANICNVLRLDIEQAVALEEVEESDSDEDTILAYKELYQLNTALTKYTSTTTTTTATTTHQNIAEEQVEGNNDYRMKVPSSSQTISQNDDKMIKKDISA